MKEGIIFDIKRYAIHDGPGIRTTVFFKKCPLNCWWCHNPEGISPSKELMYFEYKCIFCKTCQLVCPLNAISINERIHKINRESCNGCGICSESCPTGALRLVGRTVTCNELIEEIEKDTLLYDSSGGGVTFSGGEPLSQSAFLIEVLKECKKRYIHTALDTSGYAPGNIFESVIDYVDLFLFDIKLFDEKNHIKYTGVSNKLIKQNLSLLLEKGRGKDIILRFPVITGITDTEENIESLASFIASLKGINEIDLLPFHDICEKYQRLGKEYKMPTNQAPPEEKIKYIKNKFEKIGLFVKIGG
ncbi:glycyl-radical enzyme activating protein [Thermovenabulum gondwanense]|uniref:4-hydroxyphenylacetate decarboxylase activating enzyme n=1 Tax=Thermovenabulum gondwanense TaxID=520767 RepID=A0A162MVT1_9FIRM|nr:glycyl-radical enzyme activating protein [Thermovenabulum gondwanense]KYO67847.1 4-hydroxyphenylacetate decarboxylase activating enzyme [Thermovenabulum gondwanense]